MANGLRSSTKDQDTPSTWLNVGLVLIGITAAACCGLITVAAIWSTLS